MKKVKVKSVLTLFSGRIGLTASQAKPRAHCLKKLKGEVEENVSAYEIQKQVQFKVGEELFLDEIPNSIEHSVEIFDSESKDAKTKGKK